MKYKKESDGNLHIYVGPDETEIEVLIAIINASFKIASNPNSSLPVEELSRDEIEQMIHRSRWDKSRPIVVDLIEVKGHACRILIRRVICKHFSMHLSGFEEVCGDIKPMMRLAQQIFAVQVATKGRARTRKEYELTK